MNSLNNEQIQQFIEEGFVRLDKAFPASWRIKVVQFSGDIPVVILVTQPPGQNLSCGLGITIRSHFVER